MKIEYTCDKEFGDLKKTSNQKIRTCDLCKKSVSDNRDKIDKRFQCGFFSLNQIDLFKRSYIFKTSAVSLITVLGLSMNPMDLYAKTNKNFLKKHILNERTSDTLKIHGYIIDKQTNNPVEYGSLEILNKDSTIAVTYVGKNGRFFVEVDTSKNPIENLYLFFNDEKLFEHRKSDKKRLSELNDGTYRIELNVETEITSSQYFITGRYTEIEKENERKPARMK